MLNNFCKLKCNMSRFGVKCLICEDYYEFENTLNANYPDDFDFKKYSYVVDAVDTVTAKIEIIKNKHKENHGK